jgi:hypothetical protein
MKSQIPIYNFEFMHTTHTYSQRSKHRTIHIVQHIISILHLFSVYFLTQQNKPSN